MASVVQASPNRWVVHLASRSDSDSEITVELRMSKAVAERLAQAQASRMAVVNPGRTEASAGNVGSVVLGILSSVSAIGRVKERISRLDQQEVMGLIDREVEAVRASRP